MKRDRTCCALSFSTGLALSQSLPLLLAWGGGGGGELRALCGYASQPAQTEETCLTRDHIMNILTEEMLSSDPDPAYTNLVCVPFFRGLLLFEVLEGKVLNGMDE